MFSQRQLVEHEYAWRGIRYAYDGNVYDVQGRIWCRAASELLIARARYRLGAWNLTQRGRCRRCGH